MRSSFTLLLAAGAFALAGAASTASAIAASEDSAATTPDYKAQLDQCKYRAPTDQTPCRDAVGMRQAEIDRSGGDVTPEMGSLQGRDKCELLNRDGQRDCLLNDKGG
jgi:hypothetical protein